MFSLRNKNFKNLIILSAPSYLGRCDHMIIKFNELQLYSVTVYLKLLKDILLKK